MMLDHSSRVWISPLILALILALAALLLYNVDAAGRAPGPALFQRIGGTVTNRTVKPAAYLPWTPRLTPPAAPPNKFGIDPLHPIDITHGALSPISGAPELVAATGADWVRLNFVLGPWAGVDDPMLHHGRTWQETYARILDGYRSAGLQVYALISYEAMPEDPGDSLRAAPPPGATSAPWIDRYVETLIRILHRYGADIQAVETINEPDDWHGGHSHWIHPGWFAILQQQVYHAVKSDPSLAHITVVSGPLQGFANNHNAAANYLLRVYWEGKTRFGWGQEGTPFPFDGVGYHLYLNDRYFLDAEAQQRAVAARYDRYLGQMHAVMQEAEGQARPIYLSEIGFTSRDDDEQRQADNLQTVLALVAQDPRVALGVWFALQDFPLATQTQTYGLYRSGALTPDNQKPAFAAFHALTTAAPHPQ